MNNILTLEEIKNAFPDQWVLVGNPRLDSVQSFGPIIDKLVSGVVLLASKDKWEIGHQTKELRNGFKSVTCIYTDAIPQNRKWLL